MDELFGHSGEINVTDNRCDGSPEGKKNDQERRVQQDEYIDHNDDEDLIVDEIIVDEIIADVDSDSTSKFDVDCWKKRRRSNTSDDESSTDRDTKHRKKRRRKNSSCHSSCDDDALGKQMNSGANTEGQGENRTTVSTHIESLIIKEKKKTDDDQKEYTESKKYDDPLVEKIIANVDFGQLVSIISHARGADNYSIRDKSTNSNKYDDPVLEEIIANVDLGKSDIIMSYERNVSDNEIEQIVMEEEREDDKKPAAKQTPKFH